jgi:signal transduction histidine kinase
VIFMQRALNFISSLQRHKVLVILAVTIFELFIGVCDYLTGDAISLTSLHYLTIGLAAIIFGLPGVVVVSGVATVSFYVGTYISVGKPIGQLTIVSIILTFLIFLLVGGITLLILRLLDSLHQSNQALSEKVSQLQASRARIELLTAERERNRLARELHDGVAKTLLGVEYSATALAQTLPPDNKIAHEKAEFIQNICHQEGQQLREIILDLRQGYKGSLFQLIKDYLQRWQVAYGSQTNLVIKGSDDNLEHSLVYELMTILEETLENVQRHSQASRVWIMLEVNHQVLMQVYDNGQGVSPELLAYFQQPSVNGQVSYILPPWRGKDGRPRFGLTGMMERAEWLGGQVQLTPSTEGGLCVTVCVPLRYPGHDFTPSQSED